jgi:hypothetical protein
MNGRAALRVVADLQADHLATQHHRGAIDP